MLGFSPSPIHKGVYIDGHECPDVVDYRNLYLRKLQILEMTHADPPPCSDEAQPTEEESTKKKLVLIYHDESTFNSNNGESWVWAETGKQPIHPKGQGCGLMVSEFIDEHNGFLKLSDEEFEDASTEHPGLWKEARFILKFGIAAEGQWNNEKCMHQVRQAVTIAEIKYPTLTHNIVFLFDQSSGHTAYVDDALNVNRMNVHPGATHARYYVEWHCAENGNVRWNTKRNEEGFGGAWC